MTIQLTQARVVNGSPAAAGTQHTLAEAVEADFITNGWATRVGAAPNQSGLGVPVTARTVNGSTVLSAGGVALPIIGMGSSTIVPVSRVAEIIEALADLTPLTTRFSQTAVITATNGSAIVTGVSTSWRGTNKVAVGDLWKPDAGSRYYKVKFVDSDTQIRLWEPYQGTTISAASTAFKFYYFNRYNIVMAPGDYTVVGAAPIVLKSGFDFTALDAYATSLNEGQSSPNSPFSNLGDNNFTNIRWAPTNAFGAMDGMFGSSGYAAIDPTLWAGARASFNRCIVHATNQRDIHAGGTTRVPLLGGGVTEYNQCEFLQDHMFSLRPGGAVTNTAANTRLIMNGCKHTKVAGSDTGTGFLLYPAVLQIGDASGSFTPICTADIVNPLIHWRDLDAPVAAIGNAAGILVNSASIVNINGGQIRVENSSGGAIKSIGVEVTAAATVNIQGTDVEASGTTGTGVLSNHASAVVNVRAGSRVKGSAASSGVVNTAGTVSVSPNADVIGGTTGTIGATAT